jgi:hypothetical protein
MTGRHIEIVRQMWAGLRLTDKAVIAPNGNVVQRIRHQTLMDLKSMQWIEPDPTRAGHYRLTDAGKARALVKQRVEDFLNDLTNHQPA